MRNTGEVDLKRQERALVSPETARMLLGSNPTSEECRNFDEAFEVWPAMLAPTQEIPFFCGDPSCWVCAERKPAPCADELVGTTTTEDDGDRGGWCR